MEFRGRVEVIFGSMWSGKTTELLRRIRRYGAANKSCLVLKHSEDARYSKEDTVTHDNQRFPAVHAQTIKEGIEQHPDAEVIGIDEGQFFSDLVEMCDRLANEGKIVIVAALDGNFKRKPFENTIGLIARADEIVKLHAVCMKCYEPGVFTKRISEEEEEVVIGGKDKYMTLCRYCYFN